MLNFTCQSKSFITTFFTCQVSACELQPFSCHDLANDIYSQTAKTVFSHLNDVVFYCVCECEHSDGRLHLPHRLSELHSIIFWFFVFPLIFAVLFS